MYIYMHVMGNWVNHSHGMGHDGIWWGFNGLEWCWHGFITGIKWGYNGHIMQVSWGYRDRINRRYLVICKPYFWEDWGWMILAKSPHEIGLFQITWIMISIAFHIRLVQRGHAEVQKTLSFGWQTTKKSCLGRQDSTSPTDLTVKDS